MSTRIPSASYSVALLVTAALLSPAIAQSQSQPPAAPRAGAANGITRVDAASPTNAGRRALSESLNDIAAKDAAARRATIAAIKTRADAQARQARVRAKLVSLIGPMPERTPLNAQVLGTTQADGFRIEKILFDSQPGFHVTGLLYLPDGKADTRLPAVLMAPGHAATGKAGDYAQAAAFARNGFAVLSYDPIGQGERLQYPDPARPGESLAQRPTGEHGEASLQPMLIGETFDKYEIWDAIRGVDYLSSRPEIDPARIGAMGCSGGGTITAITAALEPRIAATGVACYTTSFDELLSLKSVGPQDAEQSIPGFIAPGPQNLPLDFPDWIEVVAPRPYAVLATYNDMFPFAGARSTVIEARRFYSLFDPASAAADTGTVPPTPTEPALNPDTTSIIPPTAALQFITGPGGHGNLGPIMDKIVSFFIRNLQPGADAAHPIVPAVRARTPGAPAAPPSNGLPKDALQVTATGQVATSYPGSETVFSLNLKRAEKALPAHRPVLTGAKLASTIRDVTGAAALPGASRALAADTAGPTNSSFRVEHLVLGSEPGIDLNGEIAIPTKAIPSLASSKTGAAAQSLRYPAVLLLIPDSMDGDNPTAKAGKKQFEALAAAGNIVLAVTPRPSPPGTEESKAGILGDMYLTTLRAMLVGKTILGLRVDDTIRITDYLLTRKDVDPANITAQASGHMGLVLLHAAVLDSRLKHVTIDHALSSYDSLLKAPITRNAPVDILPSVLLHYDIPDLTHALGARLTLTDPLSGTDDLAYTSFNK